MKKAILDTDIYSEITKGMDQAVAARARDYRRAMGHYTLSAITLMEMIRGYQRKQASRQLQDLLAACAHVEILDLDRATAELAGKIAGELEHIGRPIGVTDPIIAATAIVHGLELVTGNLAHFQRVQELGYPLTLDNWRA